MSDSAFVFTTCNNWSKLLQKHGCDGIQLATRLTRGPQVFMRLYFGDAVEECQATDLLMRNGWTRLSRSKKSDTITLEFSRPPKAPALLV